MQQADPVVLRMMEAAVVDMRGSRSPAARPGQQPPLETDGLAVAQSRLVARGAQPQREQLAVWMVPRPGS
ncbi:MAG: hypothetical protein IH627_00215 [Rubrivivax sp.]|nr:hypothetical protein [Rubrivivax sp.]